MWLPAMLHWYYSQPSLYGLTTAATMPGGGCPSGLVVPSSAGGSVFVHQRAVPCRPGVGECFPCGWFRGYPWFVVHVDDSCTYRHIDSTCTCSMYIHYLHTCMGTYKKMCMSVPSAFTSTYRYVFRFTTGREPRDDKPGSAILIG